MSNEPEGSVLSVMEFCILEFDRRGLVGTCLAMTSGPEMAKGGPLDIFRKSGCSKAEFAVMIAIELSQDDELLKMVQDGLEKMKTTNIRVVGVDVA